MHCLPHGEHEKACWKFSVGLVRDRVPCPLEQSSGVRQHLTGGFFALAQVLDEIGVDVSAKAPAAPAHKAPAQKTAAAAEEEDSLTRRLAALK